MNIQTKEVIKTQKVWVIQLPKIIFTPLHRNVGVTLMAVMLLTAFGSFNFKKDQAETQEEVLIEKVTGKKEVTGNKKVKVLSEDKKTHTKTFTFNGEPDFDKKIGNVYVTFKFPNGGKYNVTKEYSKKYIKSVLPYCLKIREETSVPISVVIFQSWWESNFGQSTLGKKGNHLGIKGSNKLSKGTHNMKDDYTWKSTFGTYKEFQSFMRYGEFINSLKDKHDPNNPYRNKGWSYQTVLWEIQHPYNLHNSCYGYGCKGCKQSGLKNTRVYATGKYPGKQANPQHYFDMGNKWIPEMGFHTIDLLYQEEGENGINKLINAL